MGVPRGETTKSQRKVVSERGILANNVHRNLLAKETNEPAYCLRFAFPSAIYCRMHYLLRGGHHREVVITAVIR